MKKFILSLILIIAAVTTFLSFTYKPTNTTHIVNVDQITDTSFDSLKVELNNKEYSLDDKNYQLIFFKSDNIKKFTVIEKVNAFGHVKLEVADTFTDKQLTAHN